MAKQTGLIKIKGTLDDVTFYKRQNSFLARMKGGISGQRIKSDPRFQRTRENMAEFQEAASMAKLFRQAFQIASKNTKDSNTQNRLFSFMSGILRTDPTSNRGERKVHLGEIDLLKGFEFNSQAKLETTLKAQPEITIDGTDLILSYSDLNPSAQISYPPNTTHFRLLAVVGAIDFENKDSKEILNSSENLLLDEVQEDLSLTLNLEGLELYHKYLAVGIEFLDEINGKFYALQNRAHNGLSIIHYLPKDES